MKKIYFVRHGESEGNIGSIHQSSVSSLTEKGKKQAVFLANRCVKFPIEIIVSSAFNRAKETAEIISDKIGKPLEISDLFIERRKPKEQIGKSKDDPMAIHSEKTIRENFHIENFQFSDEETFNDLKNRAERALVFLQNKLEENILVVTHGFFIRILMAYAVFGKELTGYECERFIRSFRMENTGITILKLDDKKIDSSWLLWIWNDHAHLG